MKVLRVTCIILAMSLYLPTSASTKAQTALKGSITKSELGDQLTALGIKCVGQIDNSNLEISRVRLGSLAFYHGLVVGDKIIKLSATSQKLQVSISRAGKQYTVLLPRLPINGKLPPLLSARDQTVSSITSDASPKPPIRLAPGSRLQDYQIEMVVDASGSMQSAVDPTNSRFSWCADQAHELATSVQPYNRTISLTFFSDQFTTVRNCPLKTIYPLFRERYPGGGTNIIDPLKARIDEFLRSHGANKNERLLVVVLTDGEPNLPPDPAVIYQYLADVSTKTAFKGQIKVYFLQVGSEGLKFLVGLADKVSQVGATYDIAMALNFSELSQIGLAKSLDSLLAQLSIDKSDVEGRIRNSGDADLSQLKAINEQNKLIQERRKQVETNFPH